MCVDRHRLKRLMQTFPATPSLLPHQFTRMFPDSSGISVDDASLDVGHSTFVTLHGPHDVAADQRSLSAEINERRQQLAAQRDELWAPMNLASIVHSHVPRSASVGGMFIFFSTAVIMYLYLVPTQLSLTPAILKVCYGFVCPTVCLKSLEDKLTHGYNKI